eukprot:CCRYP_020700-RE/>CCRYP_020700-RE protein AED:0.46 eAED:1.00 QI:0/-1/0/1/-1/0/1/0/39
MTTSACGMGRPPRACPGNVTDVEQASQLSMDSAAKKEDW